MNNITEIFTAASHHDVLALLTQIAVLLFTAKLFGEICLRLGQPAVIGELLAGIMLGPSCLGKIFPGIVGFIIPGNPVQGHLLESISLIGAIFLLLITGLETDLNLIRRHAKITFGVSIGGIILPLASGFLLGQYLPDFLLPDSSQRLIFSLFIATAMSISAIPVLAKILLDLNLMRRDIGQTIIAAGMCEDTTGWILLSIVAGLASGKVITLPSILGSVGTVAIFMFLSFTLGRWFIKKSLDFVQDRVLSAEKSLTLVIILTFMWASATQALHLEPVLGAFVMGILLGQMPRLPQMVHQRLRSIALGIFAPIFFAVAGLKVNILSLLTPSLLTIAAAVILVATIGKILGTFLGARFIGKQNIWISLAFGAALNARGAMEIIVATIGLSLGILTQEMFSIIVLMAMTTSLMAPFLLRWILKHVQPTSEEQKRLQLEQLSRGSSIGLIHRVLVPARHQESDAFSTAMHQMKSQILKKISSKSQLSTTLLSVDRPGQRTENIKFLNDLAKLFDHQELLKKAVESSDVVNVVLDEAHKDYDLLVLGASQARDDEKHLFSEVIDSLVSLSPCLTMVVHTKNLNSDWNPKRILVPTNGSFAAKRAAEFSFLLAPSKDELVHLLNVLEKDKDSWHYEVQDDVFKRQLKIAEKMVEELKELGEMYDVNAFAHVQIGSEPEVVILEAARQQNIDLIVLGTDVRPASDRLFLGPRVERILKNAPCPVIVLNAV